MGTHRVCLLLASLFLTAVPSFHGDPDSERRLMADETGSQWNLRLRSRQETAHDTGRFHALEQAQQWDPHETAIVVCDMWDLHHCLNATRRVGEMAPRMNQLLGAARDRGALVIHAPSSCMDTYKDHPARRRAQQTPRAKNMPKDIGQWCHQIPAEAKGQYPIDQSDGGEDDDPDEHRRWAAKLADMGRNPRAPWKSQIDTLTIRDQDIISDNGEEIWSVMEQQRIQNVILVGVHTNMCVLGRPFGLRQMARNGKNVVLVRDLTDTMYNPARAPYVSHFTGTDLIVEHIEKYVCPTITSDQILGGKPFQFQGDRRPRLVVVMGEREYKTNQTLPPFALKHLGKHFQVDYVHASQQDRNDFPGLEVLNDADLALISVRRRALPTAKMEQIRKFVTSGKPVVGIRTANHAFSLRSGPVPPGCQTWEDFDQVVIGGNYSGHHGVGPAVELKRTKAGADHPILQAVDVSRMVGNGSLYKVAPLAESATALLLGAIPKQSQEPVLWTNQTKWGGRVVYTSLGHPDDFQQPQFAKLLRNAIFWAAGLPVPEQVATR